MATVHLAALCRGEERGEVGCVACTALQLGPHCTPIQLVSRRASKPLLAVRTQRAAWQIAWIGFYQEMRSAVHVYISTAEEEA